MNNIFFLSTKLWIYSNKILTPAKTVFSVLILTHEDFVIENFEEI